MSNESIDAIDEGIDDDGTIIDPDQGIETFFCPLEAVIEGEGFLRIVGDNGGTNVEMRLPFAVLEQNGWKLERPEDEPGSDEES
jgi:hypothetical protein